MRFDSGVSRRGLGGVGGGDGAAHHVDDVLGEGVRGGRERAAGGAGEAGGVLLEGERRGAVGGARAGFRGEFEDGDFERGVVAAGVLAAERPHDVDGGGGRFGLGEEPEALGDEDVRGDDVEVGGEVFGLVLGHPRLVEDEVTRQPEALVDELDAGGALCELRADAGDAAGARGEQREGTGRHRRRVESVVDGTSKGWGGDVRNRVSSGCTGPFGLFHCPLFGLGTAKTFGNPVRESGVIRTRRDGDVLAVTLDRPDRRNALTPDALADLERVVTDADAPVAFLSGAGSAFCAGADLGVVRGLRGDPDAADAFARRGQRTMNAIEDSDSVVVAGVDGPARGGGVELVLACDVAVAAPNASFAETGARIGLFGAWGGTRRLPLAVGATAARDLSFSARTIDAAEARDLGLVTRVVDDPRTVAHDIAENDPAALSELGTLLRDTTDRAASDDAEAAAFARLLAEPE